MNIRQICIAIVSGFVTASMACADIIHVPGDQPTIQAGITAALAGDEVVVADGIWTGPANKNLDFTGKAITVRSASGDPLTCIIDCQQDGRAFHFHSGEGADARVEGITMRNGRITDPSIWGGAILCQNNSGPTIENCHLIDNVAAYSDGANGGAVQCAGGSPTFVDCLFLGNRVSADLAGGAGAAISAMNGALTLLGCTFQDNELHSEYAGGGAVYSMDGELTAIDCLFDDNDASWDCGGAGGGIWNQGDMTLTGCTFQANRAGGGYCAGTGHGRGGGVFHSGGEAIVTDCSFVENFVRAMDQGHMARGAGFFNQAGGVATLVNCLFRANEAYVYHGGRGGAICDEAGSLVAVNCTFVGNIAEQAGGIWSHDQGTVVANSILRDNAPDAIDGYIMPSVTHSNVQGGFVGAGNIDADPLFADLDGRLLPGSPCIDAADNNAVPPDVLTDFDGNPRFVDDPATPDTGIGTPPIVDMGAYEFQVATCPADVNGDATVNVLDLLAVLAVWGATSGPEDINGDGIVNVLDLLEVLAAWGPC